MTTERRPSSERWRIDPRLATLFIVIFAGIIVLAIVGWLT